MKKLRGFTLIELLMVIAIIGILSSIVMVSLGSSKTKSRDAKRVSDIKQVQTALELYYSDQNGYPVMGQTGVLGVGLQCLGTGAFGVLGGTACGGAYMGLIPSNPTPNGMAYTYGGASSSYTITFSIESGTGGLGVGAHTATPSGVQ